MKDNDLVVRVEKQILDEDEGTHYFTYDVFEGEDWKRFKTPEDSICTGGIISSGEDGFETAEEARDSALEFIKRMRQGEIIFKEVDDTKEK